MVSKKRGLEKDVKKVLIASEKIDRRVKQLAREITRDYKDCKEKPLLLVGVLKGAVFFLADLCRSISLPVEVDFMAVSSYGSTTKTSGVVRILKDLEDDIKGRHVVLVEDIIDTGLTLSYLLRNLKVRKPASLAVCALLSKEGKQRVPIDLKYCGFSIPDEFVVGYGLDFSQRYRNLPYIATLKPEVCERLPRLG